MNTLNKIIKKGKVVIIAGLVGAVSFLSYSFYDDYFEISKNLEIFNRVYKEVNTYYVDEVEPGKMVKTAIDAMLGSLDPYTNYYSEAETEAFRIQMTGEYGGIGAIIRQKDSLIIVDDPYEGFAAQKAGLQVGDVILEIDGTSMIGKSTSDASNLLKGTVGTELTVVVDRPGKGKITKTFKREKIKIKNVPYYGMVNETVGYIKLTGFTRDAGKEVKDALKDLKSNHNAKSVVLDLRYNGGGLLDEAINIVNIFVKRGQLVVSTKGKISQWNKTYSALSSPEDTEIPLVVLINNRSASASEIVSGSMQDLDRGVVIGQRSFGKGLVQSTMPLEYNSQMKITTAKYYTPSGRCIQALDYSHRNEDGSVGAVPDSLRKAFKTQNGRTVYDGGGVKPDIDLDSKEYSNVAISLVTNDLIYDFATKYRAEHDTIASAKNFTLTEKDFQDFLIFIKGKDYNYSTETEKALDKMKAKAEEENYFEAIKDEYNQLKADLNKDKDDDVIKNKAEIIEIIEAEIVRRYYLQSGRIEVSFDDDKELQAAVALLNDIDRYRSLLQP